MCTDRGSSYLGGRGCVCLFTPPPPPCRQTPPLGRHPVNTTSHVQCMLGYTPSPVNRMTHACENITFPTTRSVINPINVSGTITMRIQKDNFWVLEVGPDPHVSCNVYKSKTYIALVDDEEAYRVRPNHIFNQW